MSATQDDSPVAAEPQCLMSLLLRQRDLYRDLHRLADRQRRLIAEDDPGELLSLLGQRQKLTGELMELGRQLAPHRENWAATRESLAPGDCAQAEQMLGEIRGLLQKIIDDDEQDARLLSARKMQTAASMGAARADRRAVTAYAATAVQQAGRLDRISEES
ncbi:MAG: hypothetical protein ACYSUI_08080 [Planctomycetota bacterium]